MEQKDRLILIRVVSESLSSDKLRLDLQLRTGTKVKHPAKLFFVVAENTYFSNNMP